jgi:hypothetical protein
MNNAIRDLSIQFGSDQFAAILFSILTNFSISESPGQVTMTTMPHSDDQLCISVLERLLFQPETAASLGLIEIMGASQIGPPTTTTMNGPLGSIVQSQNFSMRTRGLALYFSRIIRPFWFTKAFTMELCGVMAIHPVLTSAQRNYILSLMKPVADLLTNYRHQLAQQVGGGSGETKMIEGFLVISSAIVECMELFRIVESGQMTVSGQLATVSDIEVLTGIDSLLVRDIVLSAGVGNEFLMNLFSCRDGIDSSVLRKHCPIVFPKAL